MYFPTLKTNTSYPLYQETGVPQVPMPENIGEAQVETEKEKGLSLLTRKVPLGGEFTY